eukprot:1954825-Pyramimonas_sp.AAC.1
MPAPARNPSCAPPAGLHPGSRFDDSPSFAGRDIGSQIDAVAIENHRRASPAKPLRDSAAGLR